MTHVRKKKKRGITTVKGISVMRVGRNKMLLVSNKAVGVYNFKKRRASVRKRKN